MTEPRVGDEMILIDDNVVLACSPPDVSAYLDRPDAIAAWFGARREGNRTTIRSPAGDLELHREQEDWRPSEGLLTIDGSAGPVRFHAYFTSRSPALVAARTARRARRARRPGGGFDVHPHRCPLAAGGRGG